MKEQRPRVSKASLRGLRRKERMEKLHAVAPPGVHVVPASDAYRSLLKHPTRGGFPAEGSTEWPDDRFTKRRLADGSVTRDEAARASTEPVPPPVEPPPVEPPPSERPLGEPPPPQPTPPTPPPESGSDQQQPNAA